MVGRGTEFISLYIPKNKSVSDVTNYLKLEKATASNIKSDQVRHAVQENLERCIQRLRQIKSGGLALFSGNNHLYEMVIDNIPWYYRCSKIFQTDLIILEQTPKIAILAMDLSEACFGYLQGNRLFVLKSVTSGIPNKHRKGGFSANRFEHVRQEAKHDWFKRLADYAREYFLDNQSVEKLVIHGESFTKREFLKQNLLEYRLQNIAQLSDGCYAGEDGLYECKNMLANL